MLRLLHWLILGAYLILPVLAAIRVALARKRREGGDAEAPAPGGLLITVFCAALIALPICFAYGYSLRGHVPISQFFLAIYFATGMLLLLKCFDAGLLFALRRMVRLHRPAGGTLSRGIRTLAVLLVRAAILTIVALPFVMSAVMVYRPKVIPRDTPQNVLGYPFERVEFTTGDGVKLVGWWIPAIAGETPRARQWEDFGRQTAIVCHGLAAGKANHLLLARRLVPSGFNVLIFDFRAHGESGGQVCGYGGLEKQDVLAAVRWGEQNHPRQAERIVGVGASSGAAALLEAAADPGDAGQAISAVAVYGAYDDFHTVIREASELYFHQPMPALLEHLGLPLASLHAGADLTHLDEARTIPKLWPRPVLFVHGEADEIIPIERARALYEHTSLPKYYIWFPKGSHNDILDSDTAARVVVEFFKRARETPVI